MCSIGDLAPPVASQQAGAGIRLAPPEVKTAAYVQMIPAALESGSKSAEGSPFCIVSNTPSLGGRRPRNGKCFARRGKGAGRSDRPLERWESDLRIVL
jgi:hypothetical protein